ncbi:MAG TPA: hypothetical protein P5048_02685 [Chlamydiales bacterium]|nr:hypothetical protein [Chlamydiales bacterium]
MKYTKQHLWISLDENIATVGITDQFIEHFGEVTHIDLPSVGKNFQKNECFAVLESTKAAIDLYLPFSGEVVALNDLMKEDPSIIVNTRKNDAWMIKVRLFAMEELKDLLNFDQYRNFLDQ